MSQTETETAVGRDGVLYFDAAGIPLQYFFAVSPENIGQKEV